MNLVGKSAKKSLKADITVKKTGKNSVFKSVVRAEWEFHRVAMLWDIEIEMTGNELCKEATKQR